MPSVWSLRDVTCTLIRRFFLLGSQLPPSKLCTRVASPRPEWDRRGEKSIYRTHRCWVSPEFFRCDTIRSDWRFFKCEMIKSSSDFISIHYGSSPSLVWKKLQKKWNKTNCSMWLFTFFRVLDNNVSKNLRRTDVRRLPGYQCRGTEFSQSWCANCFLPEILCKT